MNAATPVSVVYFIYITKVHYFYHGATSPFGPRPPHYWHITISLRHTRVTKTPLEE